MPKTSTIDFWLGFKYGSWQCCQKNNSHLTYISPVIKLFVFLFLLCVFHFVTQIRKNMLQKEIKDWTFEVYLLTGNPVLDSHWLKHWKWLAPDPMLVSWIFGQTQRVWIVFLQPVLLKLSKITVTCPNPIKMN